MQSRRLSMRSPLTSTIYARRTTGWMDPRRSPVCQTAAGARLHHTAEVRSGSVCLGSGKPGIKHVNVFVTLSYFRNAARCVIPAERSRVVIGGVKRWPFDVTDAMVPHGENVTFYCKHPKKQCSFTAAQACFDGKLQTPECYLGKPKQAVPVICTRTSQPLLRQRLLYFLF